MIETIHLQLLLVKFAGWCGRHQPSVITYKCVVEIRERVGGLLKYYQRRAS
jgi:hypothetical protein